MTIQDDAQEALDQSDRTVLRCAEKGIMLMPDWIEYRATLRDIISGRVVGPIPTKPDYPIGS